MLESDGKESISINQGDRGEIPHYQLSTDVVSGAGSGGSIFIMS